MGMAADNDLNAHLLQEIGQGPLPGAGRAVISTPRRKIKLPLKKELVPS
jgi:hypothetical protein